MSFTSDTHTSASRSATMTSATHSRALSLSALPILATLLSVAFSGCGSSDAGPVEAEADPLPVNVIPLSRAASITHQREFTGTITASRRTQLAFERSARLVEVLFDEGAVVDDGAVLARIDTRQLNAKIDELKARLSQQKAVLAELQAGPRAETIAAMNAEVAALDADLELRKATLTRSEDLFRRNATSAQALDEVRLGFKAATARSNALKRQLDELNAGTRVEQIEAQEALITATTAQLDALNINLTDSELTAPFAGTIVKRLRDEGDMIASQQPIFELIESNHLEARVGVPSKLISALTESDYLVMTSGDEEFTGTLRSIVPQVDPITRTQLVVLSVNLPETTSIADGQLVRLRLAENITADGFQVPVTALANGPRGLWNVYVFSPKQDNSERGVVDAREVEVVQSDGELSIIRGAIYDKERVIVNGNHRIAPGQIVTIAEPASAERE